jgi:hypothetical protein
VAKKSFESDFCSFQAGDVARSAGTTTVAMGKKLAKYDQVEPSSRKKCDKLYYWPFYFR